MVVVYIFIEKLGRSFDPENTFLGAGLPKGRGEG